MNVQIERIPQGLEELLAELRRHLSDLSELTLKLSLGGTTHVAWLHFINTDDCVVAVTRVNSLSLFP